MVGISIKKNAMEINSELACLKLKNWKEGKECQSVLPAWSCMKQLFTC